MTAPANGWAPLSAAQRRLWFISQLHGAGAAYTIPAALRLRGPLDLPALHRALDGVVARHSALRTRIVLRGGEPCQQAMPPGAVELAIIDLPRTARGEHEAAAIEAAVAAAREPFDLTAGQVFRPALVRIGRADHLLLTAMHHIISDGASIRVLHRDLVALYDAGLTATEPALPELPRAFADFTAGEQEAEAAGKAAADLAYWLERLAGTPPVLTVPADRPRPPMPSFVGLTAHCDLPPEVVDRVTALARAQRATPFMIYSAAFHVMLGRYSGQLDVPLGYAVLGRHGRASRELIGFFANTLVQRVSLAGDPTFSELLAAVRSDVVEASRHDQLRFDELVAARNEARTLDRHPIFQVLIEYFGSGQPIRASRSGLIAIPMLLDTGTARFDLELCLRQHPGPGGLDVGLKCSADLFDAATAQRMAGHYARLVAALASDPQARLSEVPLCSVAESAAILTASAGPPPVQPDAGTLWELVEPRLRGEMDRCAVRAGNTELSYAALGLMSDRVARVLRGLGVGPDTVVGICAQRSPELVAGLLGTLQAGGAYLPLDPDYPPDRLAYMLADASPRAVLVTRDTARLVKGAQHVVCLDDLPDEAGDRPPAAAPRHPDTLAYVIYTSGSTGRPKGVAVSHRAIRNRLLWMQNAYALRDDETVLQKTPLSFDVSVWEVFWPLIAGARLLLARPWGHRDAEYLSALIASERVSVVHFVPSMLRAFVRSGGLAGCSGLRLMISSGEALPGDLAAAVLAGCPAELYNLYGPTEAAVDVTAFGCRGPEGQPSARGSGIPIGRPIAGTQAYVLDGRMRPVPPGVTGEIYLGGVQLARGYLGRPGLTANRFAPDPHGRPGSRLYRTGDLGRMTSGGVIEFGGRTDGQVKLRGFRIETGEIETALGRAPGVTASVVLLDGDRLIGYVATPDDAVTPQALRASLAERLPDYMIPAAIVVLPAIPLLPTGKVDRSALPVPDSQAIGDATPSPAPPGTERERLLAAAWSEVLGCSEPPVNVSFFVAGGDSLKSIELVTRARSRGIGLTVENVFTHPTIRQLAAVARPVTATADGEEMPFALVEGRDRAAIPPGVQDAFPLSSLLSGLVFESLNNPGHRAYVTSLRVDGWFDEAAVRGAVASVVCRHPYLRSSVSLDVASEPLQLVHAAVDDPVSVIDLRDMDAGQQQDSLTRWLGEEPYRTFAWDKPPLLRVTVHLLGPAAFQLTLSEPFLDGWSVTLVITQFLAAYEQLLDGTEPSREPERSHYPAFLRAERAALASPETRRFWARWMKAASGSRLPRLAGNGEASAGYARLEVDIAPATADRLAALATELAVPVKSVLLAGHLRVLASLTGRARAVTALMANARPATSAGTSSVGLFLNTTPLAVPIQGSWSELVRAVHGAEAQTLPHRAFPYAAMLRDAGASQPAEAIFNFTHFHPYRRVGERGHVRISGLRATDQTMFPLTAQFRQDALTGRIGLALEFSIGFTAGQRDDIARRYQRTLERLSLTPEASCVAESRAAEPPPEPTTARGQVRSGATLHSLFADQLSKHPNAVAFRGPGRDQAWSYSRLDDAARGLARQLARLGIRPGTQVGICLPRSPELVAAVIATLRLGAGYVPLDPMLPANRLANLAEAARCAAIVANTPTAGLIRGDLPMARADLPASADDKVADPDLLQSAAAPAYVMFTSGSTGRPKPVAVPHEAVVNRLRWGWAQAPFWPGEVGCLKTPIGFVDSIAEMFSGLLSGVPTVIVPDHAQDPARIVDLLAREGVTRLTLVPSLLGEILRLPLDLAATLPRLRHWTLSGEPLPRDLAADLARRVPGATIWNLYGSTEVAADALAYRVTGGQAHPVVPLGRPIAGVTAFVMDELGNVAPPGTTGELVIGGLAVGTGYAGFPRMTADRFMPDPGGHPGARLYRTGDLAQRDEGGVFHFLGRADRQVKVRGVRVEPAETEMALRADPAVVEAVVAQRGGPDGRRRLVAYIEPAGPVPPNWITFSEQLRAALRNRLHSPAIPELFVRMAAWPRTPSGKIDQLALPDPPVPGRSASSRHEVPATLAERELAALWRDHLGVDHIARDDSFFALGGQSLQAIMLASRVEDRFAIPFRVSDVFDNPTLRAQAELAETLLLAGDVSSAPPVSTVSPVSPVSPVSKEES